jgi:hypothetical protein
MHTPAGKECRYFYGDYYRGRNREECRLLSGAMPPLSWKPEYCSTCPLPEISLSNAYEHLILVPRLARRFPFTKAQVSVKTHCTKTGRADFDPHIGCGECHNLPSVFQE